MQTEFLRLEIRFISDQNSAICYLWVTDNKRWSVCNFLKCGIKKFLIWEEISSNLGKLLESEPLNNLVTRTLSKLKIISGEDLLRYDLFHLRKSTKNTKFPKLGPSEQFNGLIETLVTAQESSAMNWGITSLCFN